MTIPSTAPDRAGGELPTGLYDTDPAALSRLRDSLLGAAASAGLLDIAYRTLDTPVGSLLLAATGAGVVRVAFEREDHDRVLVALAERVSPRIMLAPGRLDPVARQVSEYFDGARRAFDVPLDLQLSRGFRLDVLEHLRAIGDGELRAGGGRHRATTRRPGGRHGVRDQSPTGGRAVPSGCSLRRGDRAVRRWGRGQGVAAAP
jgi:hypothetical protein